LTKISSTYIYRSGQSADRNYSNADGGVDNDQDEAAPVRVPTTDLISTASTSSQSKYISPTLVAKEPKLTERKKQRID
jgi:hypothetical protein